jgi:hypothetical protein
MRGEVCFVVCIDLKGIDNRQLFLIVQYFSNILCCLLKERTATINQGNERKRQFSITKGSFTLSNAGELIPDYQNPILLNY